MIFRKENSKGYLWEKLEKHISLASFGLTLLAFLSIIYDYGFDQPLSVLFTLHWIYIIALLGEVVSVTFRHFCKKDELEQKIWIFDGPFLVFLVIYLSNIVGWLHIPFLDAQLWLFLSLFLVFVREFSELSIDLKRDYANPAQLFIGSFLALIFVGTLLLLLPNATHTGISFIDALFTSTSAVCVTGLIVVDTGGYFTKFGQCAILALIQAGGIGIMTFTSYFSYFFKGRSTYENQLLLKDITNAEKIGEVFDTLKKIILLTFTVEALGVVLIFVSQDQTLFSSFTERVFFSVFHAISGFCNAGFSTLPNSLYETGFRFNYSLHLIIAFLFIIGGIGFPIAFNFLKYLEHLLVNRIFKRERIFVPWVININSRIVLITTAILLTLGTGLFYGFEYGNTLAEHRGFGKIITAFFGAATPRTAGFNSVDPSALNLSTIMIVFFLMWVGASPSSTGGGIKTSTLAIGTLNFFSIARGSDRMEVFRREISDNSVRRAFAIIALSLVTIGISVFLITYFDPEKDLLSVAFESFSAYGTVGLSLGITAELSDASKMVIIATMFIGRVGMLTLLVAFLRRMEHFKYRYPLEDIPIN